ncbi:MAG TPA: hypothetical protein VKZ59_07010, partial [Acidobacteriota bacterium]|nr:hypothetical protein [Acidobacteriota bacterium]
VVEAVKDGQFHIFAIETVDQGIELLTGVEAGDPDAEGNYPENSINGIVHRRLEALAEKEREFRGSEKE